MVEPLAGLFGAAAVVVSKFSSHTLSKLSCTNHLLRTLRTQLSDLNFFCLGTGVSHDLILVMIFRYFAMLSIHDYREKCVPVFHSTIPLPLEESSDS